MTESLRASIGSLLVVGLAGPELTALERAWLKLVRPAGIILFKRNIQDAKQARTLLQESSALCAPNSLRCVDVEGGSVDRLRDALAPSPSPQDVARTADWYGKRSLMVEHGRLIGRAVKAFGFNTTLAPDLDLGLPMSAKVLGTRAAATNAVGVIEYGRAFLSGLAAEGVVGCGKHFPGLGAGMLDSHLETPSIGQQMRALEAEDLVPFRELRKELPMIMVNHAAYPNTPGGKTPASVSTFWITSVLRKRFGYRGLIFSDDLEMGGILKFMSIEEAAIAAVRAGMDLMEICHSPELILRAYESLLSEAERSAAFRALLLTRARETSAKRKKFFAATAPAALSARQFEALRQRILKLNEIVSAGPQIGMEQA